MSTTIGIDIGFETVKVIGLSRSGKKWRLIGMAIASIPHSSWQTDGLLNREEISVAIANALKAAKPSAIKGKKTMVALPESVIFSGTFSMPLLSDRELAQALPFAIADKLSINLDDYYYDSETAVSACHPIDLSSPAAADIKKPTNKITNSKSNAKKEPESNPQFQQTIFAVAAKKTLIDSVIELCNQTGLELTAIEIKPGAIARSVINSDDQKARAIIDLGAGSTGASIVEGRNIRVTSTVPWGVEPLLGKTIPASELQSQLAPVFDELVHINKFFENRVCPGVRVEEIIISGSGSNLANIIEVFQQETGLKTRLATPFLHVDTHHYPVPINLTHTFTDAIGLAMRGER